MYDRILAAGSTSTYSSYIADITTIPLDGVQAPAGAGLSSENWNFQIIFKSAIKKAHSNYHLIVGLNKSLENGFSIYCRFLKAGMNFPKSYTLRIIRCHEEVVLVLELLSAKPKGSSYSTPEMRVQGAQHKQYRKNQLVYFRTKNPIRVRSSRLRIYHTYCKNSKPVSVLSNQKLPGNI